MKIIPSLRCGQRDLEAGIPVWTPKLSAQIAF